MDNRTSSTSTKAFGKPIFFSVVWAVIIASTSDMFLHALFHEKPNTENMCLWSIGIVFIIIKVTNRVLEYQEFRRVESYPLVPVPARFDVESERRKSRYGHTTSAKIQ